METMKIRLLEHLDRFCKNSILPVRLLKEVPEGHSEFQVIQGVSTGTIIHLFPRQYLELPKEKTYTEKEWNDMENHYMDLLDKERALNKSEEVELPLEVYEAFTRLEREWRKYLDRQTMDLMLLTIMGVHAVGDALTLKEFALENATTYLKAILNGYTLSEKEREKEAIRHWYKGALVRMEDKTDPDGFAKEAIEEVALYLGGAEILADLSPFCKNQLGRKNAK